MLHDVYDEETRQRSGTNTDVLSEVVGDLKSSRKKKLSDRIGMKVAGSRTKPFSRSYTSVRLFHSMAKDLEVKYPTATEQPSVVFNKHYEIAENKLVAFLGYIADQNLIPDS